MTYPPDPLYRVYKCRHSNCESLWVEEVGASKDPRCLVCGGAVPYSTQPMSERLALSTLSAQQSGQPLRTTLKSVEKAALERLKSRVTAERAKGQGQMNELRILYEVMQQGVMS